MDMMEFLRSRRTYRRFAQRAVPHEILTEAVDAARMASCGANRQTVRYIVVESADAVATVQPLVHWAAYLPPEQGTPKADELPTAFIAVLQDDNLPGASDVDVGLALGSLTAAAWAHGVGSCIMGAIDRPALKELLALPEGVRLCYMVALGYPTHESHLVEMQDGSVKYYLDADRNYCVPKRGMDEVLLKTL
ncbi:nitroreductase family protein [Gemmiger formicilis]|uniref:nitroreductase family protein n=1 Tax=Gemmiger formicilis TaxID=745368 RepID=UPI00210C477D|nr:nitroreductase family protein [Gemmiger formicilis]MCQ5080630.1 nitroreductase family protein [Gemmiger formicilis]MCQ5116193.1 nitroreductase family protein [Gemmiger formicilis]